jgi:N-acetylglucosamine-6-phosphate deacetylase
MIFSNANAILSDRLQKQAHVRVDEGKITEISTERLRAKDGEELIDLSGRYLSPGFIDLHIHGALRRDTMEAHPDAFETILQYHAAGGTTALAFTTVTSEMDELLAVLSAVDQLRKTSSQVLGVHVEGPFFSPEKAGAHRVHLLRQPTPAEYEKMLERSHVITQMTLAPELPGALELIKTLSSLRIRPSGGHSNAWAEEAKEAFACGMIQVTHTFNCMSSARRRGAYREGGLLEFALSEPGILCELIADGKHVSPTLMRMLYNAKGADGICLVTDATSGAGLEEGGPFRLGDLACVVHEDVGFTADRSCLAGSTANMVRLVRNMVELVGVPLVEAIGMASRVPAHALNLEQKGEIKVGADADLVVLDSELQVLLTYVGGECVFSV